MVVDRMDWRLNGDLLAWLATEYPGLPPAHFEAAYGPLANPDLSDKAAKAVEEQLRLYAHAGVGLAI